MKSSLVCLLLVGVSQAVQVYLNPSTSVSPQLSLKDAGFALSRHLGLDYFEPSGSDASYLQDTREQVFVAQGTGNALLLSVSDVYASDVIPSSLKPSFSLESKYSPSSLSTLISTYLHRAPHAYSQIFSASSYHVGSAPRILDIFSVPTEAAESFMSEMSILLSFLESDSSSDKFGAFELEGLDKIAQTYGRASEEYKMASAALSAFFQSAVADGSINLAVVTFTPNNNVLKRAPQQFQSPAPQFPIGSVSTCHTDYESCASATDDCNGRGQCGAATKSGRTCYVCACSATQDDKGRTTDWVGEACERKDVSGPFTLLAGTVIGLLIVMVGSVTLLYSVGDESLPSTLTGGVAGSKQD